MGTRSVVECLELQITELEMLTSMYPKELSIADPLIVAHVRNYISGISKVMPKQLDYILRLTIPDIQGKLEVNINLLHSYPDVKPDVYARSPALSRNGQNQLNKDISDFIVSTHCEGELCVVSVVTWLTENMSKYFSKVSNKALLEHENNATENADSFTRLWIYSHHIYNKDKRRDILALGKNMGLSGFCLPGKPGIICVEGFSQDCDQFFQSIKQMNWKKLSLCHSEVLKLHGQPIGKFKRFEAFQEISFHVRKGPAREYHMDMGEFHKYLEAHGCKYAFELIFGFEGNHLSELN